MVYSTGTALAAATIGSGLNYAGGVLSATGAAAPTPGMVYSTGTALATATIGSGLSYAGGVLSAAATVPPWGMVYSTGSALATCTIGAGLSYSGGVLSATATSDTIVSNTYTASGTIATTDSVALVNAAAPVAMTLAAGSTDGQAVTVKRFGAGAVALTATIDGAVGTEILMDSASIMESVTLAWNAANATWLML
jgi:hypothetical protein